MWIPLTLAAASLFSPGLQDPASKPSSPPAVVDASAKAPAKALPKDLSLPAIDNKQVRVALSAFKAAQKVKKPNLRQQLAAVETLAVGSHAKLVKPLAKLIEKGKKLTVRRRAAEVLGGQPAKEARAAIVKLLAQRSVTSKSQLVADLVRSLDVTGYVVGKDWRQLEALFEANFGEKHRAAQQQILLLAAHQYELAALPLLIRHLDEPAPADPNAQNNPPAEYWKARWESWRLWREDVREALKALTGQTFATGQEADNWIRRNRKAIAARRAERLESR